MNRDEATKKLGRLIETIEAEQTPAEVRELYVFGSYARGAMEPDDVDIVVIHGEPSLELMKALQAKVNDTARTFFEQLTGAQKRFEAAMRRAFRKPGEKIDVILGQDLDEVISRNRFDHSDLILLWSKADKEWQAKLATLKPDPMAGTFSRHQFISPKRAGCGTQEVEEITRMLDNKELILARIPTEDIEFDLTSQNQHKLKHWTECKIMGKQALKALPYALWWMQSEQAGECVPEGTVLWNKRYNRRVQIGNLHLWEMFGLFKHKKAPFRQCLIPHIKRNATNELLVFERGPNWGQPHP